MSDIVVVLSPPLTTDQANSEEFEVGRIDYRIMGELTGVFVWAAFRVHASTVFFLSLATCANVGWRNFIKPTFMQCS